RCVRRWRHWPGLSRSTWQALPSGADAVAGGGAHDLLAAREEKRVRRQAAMTAVVQRQAIGTRQHIDQFEAKIGMLRCRQFPVSRNLPLNSACRSAPSPA